MRSSSNDALLLRSMTEDDIASVVAIAAVAFPDGRLGEDDISVYAFVPGHFGLVAERDGDVVAFMLYAKDKIGVYLSDLAVAEGCRGQGIAASMIDWLVCELPALSKKLIRLHVSAVNEPAIRVYQRSGFVADGMVPRGYPDGSDSVEMVRTTSGAKSQGTLHVGQRRESPDAAQEEKGEGR